MGRDECCTGDSWVSVHNGLFHVALDSLNHCGLRERKNDIGTKGITLYRGTEIREESVGELVGEKEEVKVVEAEEVEKGKEKEDVEAEENIDVDVWKRR